VTQDSSIALLLPQIQNNLPSSYKKPKKNPKLRNFPATKIFKQEKEKNLKIQYLIEIVAVFSVLCIKEEN
jgi:hypothetical protein